MTRPFLAIVGPTASGKTQWGLRLAQEQNAEIISVDSRQVYRFLSIGTAKPQGQWTDPGNDVREYLVEGIPYHLVDFLSPNETFSAADFVRLAAEKVREIRGRGKTPIFVGGTGFYFKALTEGLATLPPAHSELRTRLKEEAENRGRPYLHARLARVDPVSAGKIPANNIQRLVRALEVYELTGTPISQWHRLHQKKGLPLRFVGIDLSNEELHRRIERRCRRMIADGMIEETQTLLDQGVPKTCPALSGLGYPRILSFLNGRLSCEELLRLLIQDTRQYAKRQRTWFRHQLSVTWKA